MAGRKIEQLKEAMEAILQDLNAGDYFNIIEFSYSVTVRNLDVEADSAVYQPAMYRPYMSFDDEPPTIPKITEVPPAFPATPEYIKKAKEVVKKMTANGGTNIHDALKMALKVAKQGQLKKSDNTTNSTQTEEKHPQPIIIFLTDGEPTVGETRLKKITGAIHEFNDQKTSIFSLAFGEGADFPFLKRLSLINNGFARHIYEAADASLQLKNFYKQVASPLLTNVTFVYPPDQVESETITRRVFPNFFDGSELVVAGKVDGETKNFAGEIVGYSADGLANYLLRDDAKEMVYKSTLRLAPHTPSSIERLWAYLTIKQLLDKQEAEDEIKDNQILPDPVETNTEQKNSSKPYKDQALSIALKYSFVTPLTSLVVVKPNENKTVDSVSASPDNSNNPMALPLYQPALMKSIVVSRAGPERRHFGGPYRTTSFSKPSFRKMSSLQGRGSGNRIMLPAIGLSAPAFQGFSQSSASNSFFGTGMPPAAYPTYITSPASPPSSILAEKAFDEAEDMESVKLTLDSIEWLNDTRNDTDLILLKTGNNGYEELLKLGDAKDGDIYEACNTTAYHDGVCRHLSECIIPEILHDVNVYVNEYFCRKSGNYAGICCESKTNVNNSTENIEENKSSEKSEEKSEKESKENKESNENKSPESTEKQESETTTEDTETTNVTEQATETTTV